MSAQQELDQLLTSASREGLEHALRAAVASGALSLPLAACGVHAGAPGPAGFSWSFSLGALKHVVAALPGTPRAGAPPALYAPADALARGGIVGAIPSNAQLAASQTASSPTTAGSPGGGAGRALDSNG
jgi:hypothetical protein